MNKQITERQDVRGNIEANGVYKNFIDPMRIQVQWRDRYPKLGLDGKYVGDHYPICADLPPRAFLMKGAKYRLLGKTQVSQLQHSHRDSSGKIVVHVLDSSSQLLERLCHQEHENNSCDFESNVEIGENLQCFGTECFLDMVQVVQVSLGVYYEYIKPPCVHFAFFKSGEYVLKRLEDGSEIESGCVDNSYKFDTPYFQDHFSYSGRDCNVAAIVDRDGKVALVSEDSNEILSSLTYFRVIWQNETFPHPSKNNCGNYLCKKSQGSYCRCNVNVQNHAKFVDNPTMSEVSNTLSVGMFTWMKWDHTLPLGDINVHFEDENFTYTENTIFEFDDIFGRRVLLKNTESLVMFQWSNGTSSEEYMFRNPPIFFNPIPEIR